MAEQASKPWFAFLIAALFPGAGAVLGWDYVVAHPWAGGGLVALYLPLVGVVQFGEQVSKGLIEKWAPNTVDAIDLRVRSIFFGQRARYFEACVVHPLRFFDVKGIASQSPFNLDLSAVYVGLRVAPRAAHAASVNPVPAASAPSPNASEIWPVLNTGHHLAIIGAPGTGKTTLVKHVALTLAGPDRVRRELGAPKRTPLLLYVREFAAKVMERETYSLGDAAADCVSKIDDSLAGWIRAELAAGRCLVLVDGLDEVGDERGRRAVAKWIETQMSGNHGNQFVITSRPQAFAATGIANTTVLEVCPFDHDDVIVFVHGWYEANERRASQKYDEGVARAAFEGAEDLLRRLSAAPALTELAVNPLLLTLIANVHRYRSTLPGRRVELYAEIHDVFLGKRQQARDVPLDLTPEQQQRVLRALAWEMMVREVTSLPTHAAEEAIRPALARVSPETSPTAFMRMVQERSGILVEGEVDRWTFSHKTFQEFLAAAHAREAGLGGEFAGRVEHAWWHESIRLFAAMGDASAVVNACMSVTPPSITALALGAQCEEEARELDPECRERLRRVLDEALDSPDSDLRRLAAGCRLLLRSRRLVRIADGVSIDGQLVTLAEYELFMADELAAGRGRAPDHWTTRTERRWREPALGMRLTDALAFAEWFTARSGGQGRWRLPEDWEHRELPLTGAGGTGPWLRDGRLWVIGVLREADRLPVSEYHKVFRADLESTVGRSAQEPGLSTDIARISRLMDAASSGELRAGMVVAAGIIRHFTQSRAASGYRVIATAARGAFNAFFRGLALLLRPIRAAAPVIHRWLVQRIARWVGTAVSRVLSWMLSALWPFGRLMVESVATRFPSTGEALDVEKAYGLSVETPVEKDRALAVLVSDVMLVMGMALLMELAPGANSVALNDGRALARLLSMAEARDDLKRAVRAVDELRLRRQPASTDEVIAACRDARLLLLGFLCGQSQQMARELIRRTREMTELEPDAGVVGTCISAWAELVIIERRMLGTLRPLEAIRLVRDTST